MFGGGGEQAHSKNVYSACTGGALHAYAYAYFIQLDLGTCRLARNDALPYPWIIE